MIYEIRTYTLKPGSIPEFEKRFEASLANRLKYSELAVLTNGVGFFAGVKRNAASLF